MTDEADLLGDKRWGEPYEGVVVDKVVVSGREDVVEEVLSVGGKGAESDIISKTPSIAFTSSVPPGEFSDGALRLAFCTTSACKNPNSTRQSD